MVLAGALIVAIVAALLAVAVALQIQLGLSFRQALLYAPLKLAYRIDDGRIRLARNAEAPVVYAVFQQSRLDPALMLSLLPAETLHILDEDSARSAWLEPWRELARTIAFNAEHVFISRRLVRHLRGKGRLAVYFPPDVEPDARSFRLYRAVARIAAKSEARVVPVAIGGARQLPFSLLAAGETRRRWFPRLGISALEPLTMAELQAALMQARPSNALFDRVAEARLAAEDVSQPIFRAIARAADAFGPSRIVYEDLGGTLTYRQLLRDARRLAYRLARVDQPGEAVGLILPQDRAGLTCFLALQAAGRVAAMLDPRFDAIHLAAAIRIATIRTVIASRQLAAEPALQESLEAIRAAGATLLWLEDLSSPPTAAERGLGSLFWRHGLVRRKPDAPAAIFFSTGKDEVEGTVFSHHNLVANARQIDGRLSLSTRDRLLNALPAYEPHGLLSGIILPLLKGLRIIGRPLGEEADMSALVRATLVAAPARTIASWARQAPADSLTGLRATVCSDGPVTPATRQLWRSKGGGDILEAWSGGGAPVAALNTITHSRESMIGRLLPGMRAQFAPLEGLPTGGRLALSGPNLAAGHLSMQRPGTIQPTADWHETGTHFALDREGFLFMHGSADRIARLNAREVPLAIAEGIARLAWPEAVHAAVVLPDDVNGDRIVLVTTEPNAEAGALRQFAAKNGYDFSFLPDAIVQTDALPERADGSPDESEVRRLAEQRLGIGAAA